MTDVRLTATNPEDSSVVPVACNEKGELLLEEPQVVEGPPGPQGPPGPDGPPGDSVVPDASTIPDGYYLRTQNHLPHWVASADSPAIIWSSFLEPTGGGRETGDKYLVFDGSLDTTWQKQPQNPSEGFWFRMPFDLQIGLLEFHAGTGKSSPHGLSITYKGTMQTISNAAEWTPASRFSGITVPEGEGFWVSTGNYDGNYPYFWLAGIRINGLHLVDPSSTTQFFDLQLEHQVRTNATKWRQLLGWDEKDINPFKN